MRRWPPIPSTPRMRPRPTDDNVRESIPAYSSGPVSALLCVGAIVQCVAIRARVRLRLKHEALCGRAGIDEVLPARGAVARWLTRNFRFASIPAVWQPVRRAPRVPGYRPPAKRRGLNARRRRDVLRRRPYFRRLAGCSVVSRMFSAAPMTSADEPTISGSGPTTTCRSLFGYGSEERKCCMQLMRARFLSSDLTIVQGASAVSVLKNIASFASVYSSHLSSEALSIGDSFHCFSGIGFARGEAASLLLARHREPVFEQANAGAHQHPLELRALAHEFEIFVRLAEAHHALDAGAVVPGAVEEHDFARGGQMLDVALEVPLRALALVRLFQRHDARAARIEMLHEALDRAALAGRVAPLEQNDDLLAGFLDPVLRLQELRLQRQHALDVVGFADLRLVGIVAGLEGAPDHVGIVAQRLDFDPVGLSSSGSAARLAALRVGRGVEITMEARGSGAGDGIWLGSGGGFMASPACGAGALMWLSIPMPQLQASLGRPLGKPAPEARRAVFFATESAGVQRWRAVAGSRRTDRALLH